jgi:hypothetical protein
MMDPQVLLELAAVRKRSHLNDVDNKFISCCLQRIIQGQDLTGPMVELLHRMYTGPTTPRKERPQRVGYTLIDNATGKKICL